MSVPIQPTKSILPEGCTVVAERPSILNTIEAVVAARWSHLGDGKMSKGA